MRIWATQVMVDHLSDLSYLHIIISTIQEENLLGIVFFEIWAPTFGVKFNIYHADKGIFSKQPFISSIEDYNQTITFWGFGYHHQNAIIEGKIQNYNTRSYIFASRFKNIYARGNNFNFMNLCT